MNAKAAALIGAVSITATLGATACKQTTLTPFLSELTNGALAIRKRDTSRHRDRYRLGVAPR